MQMVMLPLLTPSMPCSHLRCPARTFRALCRTFGALCLSCVDELLTFIVHSIEGDTRGADDMKITTAEIKEWMTRVFVHHGS